MNEHLSLEQLSGYLLGTLTETQAETVASHLASCDTCEELASKLETQPDELIRLLRSPGELPELEPACQEAMALVQSMVPGDANAGRTVGTALVNIDTIPAAIRELGPYELQAKLGEGGMGAVYKALHRKLKRVVAIKVLPAELTRDARAIARFEREMEAVGKLDHPNIVRATDADEYQGTHYLVMEYVQGTDLSQLVHRLGPLAIPDACELIRQAAVGLQHAHEHGLVHRDIKPSNLMLTTDGRVKLLDLGLALLHSTPSDRELTTSGQIMGTVDYMSPEQAGGSHAVDIRADIYSLGAALYKLLSGVAPFAGAKHETLMNKLVALATQPHRPIHELRAGVPAELSQLIDRLLCKDPAGRYSTPAEVAESLAPFVASTDLRSLLQAGHETGPADTQAITNEYLTRPSTETTPSHPVSAAIPTACVSTCAVAPNGPRRLLPKLPLLTAAGGLLGLILAGVFTYRIVTDSGELQITCSDPNVEVTIKRNGRPVKDLTLKQGQNEYSVRSGEVEVILRGANTDHFLIENGKITLSRGDRPVVRISSAAALTPSDNEQTRTGQQQESFSSDNTTSRSQTGAQMSLPNRVPPNLGNSLARSRKPLIEPDPKLIPRPGEPLGRLALVQAPTAIPRVRSWSLETRRHHGAISALAISNDGRLVATGGRDGAVRIWDMNSRQLKTILLGHELNVSSLAWEHESRYLASSSQDGTIRIWNTTDGTEVRRLRNRAPIYDIAWSPDSNARLASATGNEVVLWDLERSITQRRFVNCTAFSWSPDGRALAVARHNTSNYNSQVVEILDAESGEVQTTFENTVFQQALLTRLAWSHNGKNVAALAAKASETRLLCWKVQDNSMLFATPAELNCSVCLCWSQDDKFIASGMYGSSSYVLDATNGSVVAKVNAEAFAIQWASNNSSVVLGNKYGVFVFDMQSRQVNPISLCCWYNEPGGSTFTSEELAADGMSIATWGIGSQLRFHDLRNGRTSEAVEARSQWPITFSPKSTWVHLGGVNEIRRVSTDDSISLPGLREAQGYHCFGAFSADESRFAGAQPNGDSVIRIWELNEHSPRYVNQPRELKGHKRPVVRLAWEPQGERIVSRSNDGEVKMWDTSTGTVQFTILSSWTDWYGGPIWAKDGVFIAVANDSAIDLHDSTSGVVLRSFRGCKGSVMFVKFIDDDETLVAQDDSGRVTIWDVANGAVKRSFACSGQVIGTSPDEKILLCEDFYTGRHRFVGVKSGEARGTLIDFESDSVFISSGGHVATLQDRVMDSLVVVVRDDLGCRTLDYGAFVKEFGWRNDSSKVRIDE